MNKKGMNLENVKMKNKSAIIRILNDKGPMSRKDIAGEIGLTPATVTLLCNEMINDGIICENGDIKEEQRAGRKKILIDINCSCKYVGAVYIGSESTYIYLCDLKSNPIKKAVIKTDSEKEPEVLLEKVAKKLREILKDVNKSFKDILGVGVSIPGIVDSQNGISIHAYGIWNTEVNIRGILENYIPCDILVENNIKAFAQGELVYGSGRKKNNILFLRWGPGVGASMIIDNKLYEGNGNKALEIGHYIVNPDGPLCKCGKRGCLETKVSVKLIFEEVSSIFSEENTPKLYKSLNGKKELFNEEYFEEWISSIDIIDSNVVDKSIYDIIEENIKVMALVVSNAITLFAPDETILFGTIFDNEKIEKLFLEHYGKYESGYKENSIHKSSLSKKIQYLGPTAVVVKKILF